LRPACEPTKVAHADELGRKKYKKGLTVGSVLIVPVERGVARDAWFVRRNTVTSASAPGPLTDLLRLLGGASDEVVGELDLMIPLWRVHSGAILLHEGAPVECVHVVRSGTFKSLKTSEDGYEQVLGFAGPGEVLGFEALCRGRQPMSAVALEDSTVYALPVRSLDGWRQGSPALDHALQFALSRQLARVGEITEMMAAVAAEVRLARFLVWLSSHMLECGQSSRRLRLRMSRRDIASLLGVAHETVSRSFGSLVEWGYLRVDNREVEILDLEGLKAFKRCTRGFADQTSRRNGAGQAAEQPIAALA
jgi:CRP/FNR family transcriptional regulator, anaerobic regulatory protein